MNPQDYQNQPQNPYPAEQNPLSPVQPAQRQFYGAQPQGAQQVRQGFAQVQNPYAQPIAQNPQYQHIQQDYSKPAGGFEQISNIQNQPQVQPYAQPISPQVTKLPEVVPEQYRATVSQNIETQNPYTVDYLERIAPKQETPFWTKGKMALAGFLGVALILALGIMIFGSRGDDDKTATLRIYYNLEEAKLIAKKYQKKIKNSDLSADNAGISSSLTSDQEAIERYMVDKKMAVPKASEKKKSQVAQQVAKEYLELDKKIEDAHLAGRMDENYSREFGYQLVLIKDLISKNAKSVGKKSREKLEPIIKNLDVAITKFDNFLKNSK